MERKTKKRHNKHHLDKRVLSKRRNTMSGGAKEDYAEYVKSMKEDEDYWTEILNNARPIYEEYMKLKIKYDQINRALFDISDAQDRRGTVLPGTENKGQSGVLATIRNTALAVPAGINASIKNLVNSTFGLSSYQGATKLYYYYTLVSEAISAREDEINDAKSKKKYNDLFSENNGTPAVQYEFSNFELDVKISMLEKINEQLTEMLKFIETPATNNKQRPLEEVKNRLRWIMIETEYYGITQNAGNQTVALGGIQTKYIPPNNNWRTALEDNLDNLQNEYNEKKIEFNDEISKFQRIKFENVIDIITKTILKLQESKEISEQDKQKYTEAFNTYMEIVHVIESNGYYSTSAIGQFNWSNYIENRRKTSGLGSSYPILKRIQDFFPNKFKSDSVNKIEKFSAVYVDVICLEKGEEMPSSAPLLLKYGEVFEKHDSVSYLNDEFQSIFNGIIDDSQHMCNLTIKILTNYNIAYAILNNAAAYTALTAAPLLNRGVLPPRNIDQIGLFISLIPNAVRITFNGYNTAADYSNKRMLLVNILTHDDIRPLICARNVYPVLRQFLPDLPDIKSLSDPNFELVSNILHISLNAPQNRNLPNSPEKLVTNAITVLRTADNTYPTQNALMLSQYPVEIYNQITLAVLNNADIDAGILNANYPAYQAAIGALDADAAAAAGGPFSSRQLKRAIALASYPGNKLFQLIINTLTNRDVAQFLLNPVDVATRNGDPNILARIKYDLVRSVLNDPNTGNNRVLAFNAPSDNCGLPMAIPSVDNFILCLPYAVVKAYDRATLTADISKVVARRNILNRIFNDDYQPAAAGALVDNPVSSGIIVEINNANLVAALGAADAAVKVTAATNLKYNTDARNAYNSLRYILRYLSDAPEPIAQAAVAGANPTYNALAVGANANFERAITCAFPCTTGVEYNTNGNLACCIGIGGNCVYIIQTTKGGDVYAYGKIIKRIVLENNEIASCAFFCNNDDDVLIGLYTRGSDAYQNDRNSANFLPQDGVNLAVSESIIKSVPEFNNIKLINWKTGKEKYELNILGNVVNNNLKPLIRLTQNKEQFIVAYRTFFSLRDINTGQSVIENVDGRVDNANGNVQHIAISSNADHVILACATTPTRIWGWRMNADTNTYEQYTTANVLAGGNITGMEFSQNSDPEKQNFIISYGTNIAAYKKENETDASAARRTYVIIGAATNLEGGDNVACMKYCDNNDEYLAVGMNRTGVAAADTNVNSNVFICKLSMNAAPVITVKMGVVLNPGISSPSINSIGYAEKNTLLIGRSDYSISFQSAQIGVENTVEQISDFTGIKIVEYTPNFNNKNPASAKMAVVRNGEDKKDKIELYDTTVNAAKRVVSNKKELVTSNELTDKCEITCVAFDNIEDDDEKNAIVVACCENKLFVWNGTNTQETPIITETMTGPDKITSISYNSTNNHILVGFNNGIKIYTLDLTNNTVSAEVVTIPDTILATTKVLISPNGNIGVAGCADGSIYSFSMDLTNVDIDIKKYMEKGALATPVTSLTFMEEDKKLVCGYKGFIKIWDVENTTQQNVPNIESFKRKVGRFFSKGVAALTGKERQVKNIDSFFDKQTLTQNNEDVISLSIFGDRIAVANKTNIYIYTKNDKWVQGAVGLSGRLDQVKVFNNLSNVSYVCLTTNDSYIDNANGTVNNVMFTSPTGEIVINYTRVDGVITSMNYSNNGSIYVLGICDSVTNYGLTLDAAVTYAKKIAVYDSKTRKMIQEISLTQGTRFDVPSVIKFNPNTTIPREFIVAYGQFIMKAVDNGQTFIIKPVRKIPDNNTITDIIYNTQNSNQIAILYGSIQIYDFTRSPPNIDTNFISNSPGKVISSITYSNDSTKIIVSSNNRSVAANPIASEIDYITVDAATAKIDQPRPMITLSDNASYLITSIASGNINGISTIVIGTSAIGKMKVTVPKKFLNIKTLSSALDVTSDKNNIYVYDSDNKKQVFKCCAFGGPIKSVMYSSDNTLIYALVDNTNNYPIKILLSAYLAKYAEKLVTTTVTIPNTIPTFPPFNPVLNPNPYADPATANIYSFSRIAHSILNNFVLINQCFNRLLGRDINTSYTPATDNTTENIILLVSIPGFIQALTSLKVGSSYCKIIILLLQKINQNILSMNPSYLILNENGELLDTYLKDVLVPPSEFNSNSVTRSDVFSIADKQIINGNKCVSFLYSELTSDANYEKWIEEASSVIIQKVHNLNDFYQVYIQSKGDRVSMNNIQMFDATTGKYNNSYYTEDTDILISILNSFELITVPTNSRLIASSKWDDINSRISNAYSDQFKVVSSLALKDTIDFNIFAEFYNKFQSNLNYYTWRKPFFYISETNKGQIEEKKGIESRILSLIADYINIDPKLTSLIASKFTTEYNKKLYTDIDGLNINKNQNKNQYFDNEYDELNFIIGARPQLLLSTNLLKPSVLKLTNENRIITSNENKRYTGNYYRTYTEYKLGVIISGAEKSWIYTPHGYGQMYYATGDSSAEGSFKQTSYRGFWRKGKYHGYGELCYGEFNDKISPVYLYRGFWVNGVPNGPGVLYEGEVRFENKIVYIGNVVNVKPNGQGLYLKEYDAKTKTGKIYSGYWVEGFLGWTDDSFKTRSNAIIQTYDGSNNPKSTYDGQVMSSGKEDNFFIPSGEGTMTEINANNTETVMQGNFNTNGNLSGQNASIKTIDKNDNKVTVQSGVFKDGKPILVKEDVTTKDGETKATNAQLFTYDDKGVKTGDPVTIDNPEAVNDPTKVPEKYTAQVQKDITEITTEKTQQDQRVNDTGRRIATSLGKEDGEEGVGQGATTSTATIPTKTPQQITAEQRQKQEDTVKQIEGDKQSFIAMKQLQTGKYVKLGTNFTDGQNTSIIKFGEKYRYIGPAKKQQNDNQILISREYGRLEKINGDILIPPNSNESKWSKVVVTDKKYKDDAELPPQWTEYRPYAIFDIIPKDSEVAKMFSQSVTDALFSTTTPDQSKSFIGDTSTLKKMSDILYRDIVIYVNAYIKVLEKLMGGKTPKMNASGEQVDSCGRPIQIQSGGTRSIEDITKAIDEKNAEIVALKEANDAALSSSDPQAEAAKVEAAKKLETAETELSGLQLELSAADAEKIAKEKEVTDLATAEELKKKQEEELKAQKAVIDLTGVEEEKTDEQIIKPTTETTAPQKTTTTVGPNASEFDTFINNMYNNLTADDSEYQSFKNMDPNIIQDLPLDDNFVKSVLNAIIASVSPNAQNLLSSDSIGKYDDIQVLLILNKNIIILFSMYLIVISKLSVEDPFVVLNMYNGFRQAYNKTMTLKQVPNMEETAEEIFNNQTTNAFIKSILAALAFSVTAGGVTAAASGMFSPTMGGKKYTKRKKVIKKQYNTKRQRKLNLKGKKYVTRKLRKKKRVKKNKDKKK
jgi:hypothetical protein